MIEYHFKASGDLDSKITKFRKTNGMNKSDAVRHLIELALYNSEMEKK